MPHGAAAKCQALGKDSCLLEVFCIAPFLRFPDSENRQPPAKFGAQERANKTVRPYFGCCNPHREDEGKRHSQMRSHSQTESQTCASSPPRPSDSRALPPTPYLQGGATAPATNSTGKEHSLQVLLAQLPHSLQANQKRCREGPPSPPRGVYAALPRALFTWGEPSQEVCFHRGT